MKKSLSNIPKIVWFQLFLLALGYAFYSANRLSFGVGLKAVAASISLTAIWQTVLDASGCLSWGWLGSAV